MNKNYLDYGKEIPGAKKSFYIEDYYYIKEDSTEEQFTKATKNNIWKYRYHQSVDPFKAFIIRTIRNSLASKPFAKDKESIKLYVDVVTAVRDYVKNAKTEKELINLALTIKKEFNRTPMLQKPIEFNNLYEAYVQYLDCENNKKSNKRNKVKKLKPILLDELVHNGSDYRKGKEIITSELADTFEIAGVQYGNYVPEKERKLMVTKCYDALCDLANLLGINYQEIGLNNNLSLAFGARGSGKASAHYEPDYKVINLTRLKGQGTIAHEWFHSLDHFIGQFYGSNILMSDNWKECPNLEFRNLCEYISNPKSEFYQNSLKMDIVEHRRKNYWSSTREMLARAFQVFVVDELEKQGIRNDYLSTVESYKDDEENTFLPYPRKEEKQQLSILFKVLFKSLIRAGIFKSESLSKVASN